MSVQGPVVVPAQMLIGLSLACEDQPVRRIEARMRLTVLMVQDCQLKGAHRLFYNIRLDRHRRHRYELLHMRASLL